MNEKIPTMEGGRMGREGKYNLGLVGKSALESETPSFNPRLGAAFSAREDAPSPGAAGRIRRAKSKDSAWLGATLRAEWLRLTATACGHPSGSGHGEEAALEPPSPPVSGDVDSRLWGLVEHHHHHLPGLLLGARGVTPNTSLNPSETVGTAQASFKTSLIPSVGTFSLSLGTS